MSYTHALGRGAELFQKVQQLETENADISHAYRVTRDVVKGLCEELANLKDDNAELRRLIDDPNAMHSHYLRNCKGWEVWPTERVRGLERENESLIENVRGLEPMVDRLERENVELREQIAVLGEIGCLNLDDSTVGKCDAITGDGEKYKDVMRRLFVDQPKELAALREDNAKLKKVIHYQGDEIRARTAIDTARAKEDKPDA